MKNRLARLRAYLKVEGPEALLISKDVNIHYLTGHPSCDAWLLITLEKAYYITDFRYMTEVKKKLKGIEVVQFKESLYDEVIRISRADKIKTVGFDSQQLTVYQYNCLKKIAGKTCKLMVVNNLVEAMRALKDPGEINLIKVALKINIDMLRYIKRYMKPGETERGILNKLKAYVQKRDVRFSFDPIIASGPNSALPHAKVTDRKFRSGEPVLLDCGIEYKGYKSDLTRMFFLGKMAPAYMRYFNIIKKAQEKAYAVIRPGIAAQDVDKASRSFLAEKGLAAQFGHSLGHGVGLDIHERPRISSKSGVSLYAGMVITVEPGIYFPGKYGVRQEDMVLVTQTGCEVLSETLK